MQSLASANRRRSGRFVSAGKLTAGDELASLR